MTGYYENFLGEFMVLVNQRPLIIPLFCCFNEEDANPYWVSGEYDIPVMPVY